MEKLSTVPAGTEIPVQSGWMKISDRLQQLIDHSIAISLTI
jgi:hypothetical protein